VLEARAAVALATLAETEATAEDAALVAEATRLLVGWRSLTLTEGEEESVAEKVRDDASETKDWRPARSVQLDLRPGESDGWREI